MTGPTAPLPAPEARRRLGPGHYLLGVKAAITVGLICWLVLAADWAALGSLMAAARVEWIVFAVSAHLAALWLASLRWWLMVRYLIETVGYRDTVPSFYLGLFANNFMPGVTGMDVVRVVGLRREGLSAKPLVAAVLVERVLGLSVVVAMAAIAALLWAPRGLEVTTATSLLLLAFAVSLVVTILTPLSGALGRWLRHRTSSPMIGHGADLLISIGQFGGARLQIGIALGLTVAIQGLVVASYVSLGQALTAQSELILYFVAVPLVFLLSSLPISLGGLGVREGSFAAIMIAGGMEEQAAIGISVLFLFQLLLLTLPGGLVLLRRRRSHRHRT